MQLRQIGGFFASRDVRVGSWLCENAKTLNRGRTSYSSKTTLAAQRAREFNLEVDLKNIILRRVLIFEFLHSQGHLRHSCSRPTTSGPASLQTRSCDASTHVISNQPTLGERFDATLEQ